MDQKQLDTLELFDLTEKLDGVDCFAGPGGWDVGALMLGLKTLGIEFDEVACKTRRAAGLPTIHDDVRQWSLARLRAEYPDIWATAVGLIMSPPCQTFSMAGRGAGRKALDIVLAAIKTLAARQQVNYGDFEDERTGLVLEPLRWALDAIDAGDPFEWLAFEQVPTVLPVWEAMADVLRNEGYSVAVGKLRAEQYGVPQTRERAILVARRTGEAKLPAATHSRYYSRNPAKLDEGLLPWVSMAEALGWGATHRPSTTVVTGANGGGADPMSSGSGGRAALQKEQTEGRWVVGFPRRADTPVNADGENRITIDGVEYRSRDLRPIDLPAQVVTEKARSWNRYLVQNKMANATVRSEDEPAPTILGGNSWGERVWRFDETDEQPAEDQSWALQTNQGNPRDGYYKRDVEAPAPTVTGLGRSFNWVHQSPSPTVAGDPRLAPRGCKHPGPGCCSNYPGTPGRQFGTGTVRVTVEEAAALQSFPFGYPWQGTKSKQFQQVGNAIPPLLASAVLAEAAYRPFVEPQEA